MRAAKDKMSVKTRGCMGWLTLLVQDNCGMCSVGVRDDPEELPKTGAITTANRAVLGSKGEVQLLIAKGEAARFTLHVA